jgi:hypothetical protein
VQVGRADLAIGRVNEGVVAAPGGEVVPEEEECFLCFILDGLNCVDRFC